MLFCQLAHTDRSATASPARGEAGASRDHPGAEQVQPVLRQRASPRRVDLFWSMTHRFRARSQLGARTHAFRFKNTAVARFDHHQSVPQSVSLGHVPPRQGRRQGLVGPRRLPARLRVDQSMHDAKVLGLLRRRVHRGHGPDDYRQFARWTDAGVYFHPHEGPSTPSRRARRAGPPQHPLRRHHSPAPTEQVSASASGIVVWDAEHEREIVLLTNHDNRRRHLQGAADRALLQGAQAAPRVKSFVGTTENAAHRQPCSPCSCSRGCTTSHSGVVACLHAAPQPLYLPSFARLA